MGSIESKRDAGVYHVEPATRFDNSLGHSKSIVYHERDVEMDMSKLRAKKIKRDVDEYEESLSSNGISCGAAKPDISLAIERKQSHIVNEHRRVRRQTTTSPFNGLDTCFMYLVIDPILYNLIYSNEGNKVKFEFE